jgi:1,4-dihydroxy-2-naphthoate octaprenyltransferase
MSAAEPIAGTIASIRPGSWRAWVLAARPATLTVAVVPVLVGTAVASATGGVRFGPALAALVGAMLIQVGTNLANDVFDHEKGADTAARLGPIRAAQSGLLTPAQLRSGMIAAFLLATVAGAYLAAVGGYPIIVIGVFSIASGIAYTGGPWPLGYNGLGDLFVMIFFGFVAVCGTVYVQTLQVPALAVFASIPIGAIATAVLVVNNTRDCETDRVAGKRTLVARFGRPFGLGEYAVLMASAFSVPVLLAAARFRSPAVLLPLLALVPAIGLIRALWRNTGTALNPVLGGTARLLLMYGVLFAAGLAAG